MSHFAGTKGGGFLGVSKGTSNFRFSSRTQHMGLDSADCENRSIVDVGCLAVSEVEVAYTGLVNDLHDKPTSAPLMDNTLLKIHNRELLYPPQNCFWEGIWLIVVCKTFLLLYGLYWCL